MTPQARPAKRPHGGCAVCTQPIGHGWLMCPRHWATVPKALQDDVTRSWGRLARVHLGSPDSRRALSDYRTARDAAIAVAADLDHQQSNTETP